MRLTIQTGPSSLAGVVANLSAYLKSIFPYFGILTLPILF